MSGWGRSGGGVRAQTPPEPSKDDAGRRSSLVHAPPPRCWRISSLAVLACLAVIAAADLMMWLLKPLPVGVQGLLDETAHAATGLVALSASGVAFELPVVLAVLGGSLLIDSDHVPGLLGSDVLTHGTPRPYTHSLVSVIAVAAAAMLARRDARKLVVVSGLALVMHFFRDMTEPDGVGVAWLWPLSDRSFALGYVWYAAAMGAFAATALAVRQLMSGRSAIAGLLAGHARLR